MIIVELQKNVYIAQWDGDPGRTLKIESAMKFRNKKEANKALEEAREFRPFLNAKLIGVFEPSI